MELVKSPVSFNQEEHTYTLAGRKLNGITGMLSRQLFPDKYKDVPEYILARAKEKGSFIHEVCELVDELGIRHESIEARKYEELKELYGLRHEASEYIVSDEEYFASAIDKVYRETDTEFTIADIKTTYKLDEEYVRWQLSIYAYLFEHQNHGCKAARLMAVWLRGEESKIVEVKRIPDDTVAALLLAEAEGRKFEAPALPAQSGSTSLPDKYRDMEAEIARINEQAKYWADKKKELTTGIMKEMVSAGAYSWRGDTVTITRKKDSIRKAFDAKAFEKDHPDLYNEYMKETPVIGSVTIKSA